MPTAMIWGANDGIGHALVKSLIDRNWIPPFWNKVPFKLPPRSLSPITAARRIIKAYHEGHKGLLDI